MSLFTRRSKKDGEESAPPVRSMLAAAMPLSGPEGKQAWKARSGDEGWQRQAWYFYDAVGELRFAFNWLASAASRATLYAAEIDPETGLVTGPTEDPRARAVAAAILGGADDRPQLQSTLFLHWQVTGETFILILPQDNGVPDRWLTLSSRAIRERSGSWSFKDPLTGVWTKITEPRDRVLRVWSPHPDEQTHADCAMRPALPILTEIEKTSQNIIARLDSRLAGNGLFFLPKEVEFTTADGEPANAQSFMKLLMEAAEIGIREPGTPAAQVPIMADIPAEYLANIAAGHVDLSTAMDSQITDLRQAALNRLGNTLEMSREIALGQMGEANHWTAWQVEEGTYKIHLEPPLLKLGMALVKEFFRPALIAMGETNPDRFVLAWDVTEVVARPDDSEDTKYLWEQGLISADWTRSKFSVPDEAIPTEKERLRALAERLAVLAPSVLDNPSVAQWTGFAPNPVVVDDASVATPVVQPPDNARELPARAATPPEPDAALVAAAELVALDALGRAGGRLLTREYRDRFSHVDKWALHTVIPRDQNRIDELMGGSFQHVSLIAAGDPGPLQGQLQAYVRNRLISGEAHDRDVMRGYLR